MILSQSIMIDGVEGDFDPEIIQVGDYLINEARMTWAEVIKISGKGIIVRYPTGDREALSFSELYQNPYYTFGLKKESTEEEKEAVSSSISEKLPEKYIVHHWVYLPGVESMGVIVGEDLRSQPATIKVKVFPNGPLDPKSAVKGVVPVTEAKLVKDYPVYQGVSGAPQLVEDIPDRTGLVSDKSFDFSLDSALARVNPGVVFLPASACVGFVRSSGSLGDPVSVEVMDPPLREGKKGLFKQMAKSQIHPVRHPSLVSSLYGAQTWRSAMKILGKCCK